MTRGPVKSRAPGTRFRSALRAGLEGRQLLGPFAAFRVCVFEHACVCVCRPRSCFTVAVRKF